MQTPEEIAEHVYWATPDHIDPGTSAGALELLKRAVEADREQRSKMEQFGIEVYSIMDGQEWSADTLQAIGDYAALTLGMPFSEPEAEEW